MRGANVAVAAAAIALAMACGGEVTSEVVDGGSNSSSSSSGAGAPGSDTGSYGGSLRSDSAAPEPCSPIGGTYEREKGPGDPECCAGLTEVTVLVQGTGADGGLQCGFEPAATFICIKGQCGDGICEAPENQLCTCPQDCGGNNPDGG